MAKKITAEKMAKLQAEDQARKAEQARKDAEAVKAAEAEAAKGKTLKGKFLGADILTTEAELLEKAKTSFITWAQKETAGEKIERSVLRAPRKYAGEVSGKLLSIPLLTLALLGKPLTYDEDKRREGQGVLFSTAEGALELQRLGIQVWAKSKETGKMEKITVTPQTAKGKKTYNPFA